MVFCAALPPSTRTKVRATPPAGGGRNGADALDEGDVAFPPPFTGEVAGAQRRTEGGLQRLIGGIDA
mgnify:CR=1 FL=1